MNDPLAQFAEWRASALKASPLRQKSAVCLSTIDEMGFPSARFVDLKEIDREGVVFCTSYGSKKGEQIRRNSKVGMTAWWDHMGYQVRVTGNAVEVSEQEARRHWQSRPRSARIATLSFDQSEALESYQVLEERFKSTEADYLNSPIPKPDNWGAYRVEPISIEFLQFRESRLHLRELFQLVEGEWLSCLLQP